MLQSAVLFFFGHISLYVFGEAYGGVLDAYAELDISERKQKAFQSLFYCYSEFRISPHQANNNNKFKKVKTSQYTVFSEPK